MRNWAQWLVNHNLRYIVVLVWFLCFPIYAFYVVKEVGAEIISSMAYDLKSIMKAQKTAR